MYDYHSKGGLGSGTGIRGYYEVLRSATKCYEVLRSATKCYEVLRSATKCYEVLRSATKCHKGKWIGGIGENHRYFLYDNPVRGIYQIVTDIRPLKN
jgi:hypothetical protein